MLRSVSTREDYEMLGKAATCAFVMSGVMLLVTLVVGNAVPGNVFVRALYVTVVTIIAMLAAVWFFWRAKRMQDGRTLRIIIHDEFARTSGR